MWEEHPGYQNAQTGIILIGIAIILFVSASGYFLQKDWSPFSTTVSMIIGFALALLAFPIAVWILIKGITKVISWSKKNGK